MLHIFQSSREECFQKTRPGIFVRKMLANKITLQFIICQLTNLLFSPFFLYVYYIIMLTMMVVDTHLINSIQFKITLTNSTPLHNFPLLLLFFAFY